MKRNSDRSSWFGKSIYISLKMKFWVGFVTTIILIPFIIKDCCSKQNNNELKQAEARAWADFQMGKFENMVNTDDKHLSIKRLDSIMHDLDSMVISEVALCQHDKIVEQAVKTKKTMAGLKVYFINNLKTRKVVCILYWRSLGKIVYVSKLYKC